MTTAQTNETTLRRPLRLWPGVVAAVLFLFLRFVIPIAMPEAQIFGFDVGLAGLFGSVLCTLAILVWWVFSSRAPWVERLGAIVLMAVALVAAPRLVHQSISGAGQGFLIYILGVQLMSLALVPWAVASRGFSSGARRATMAATILLACGTFALVRTDGVSSSLLGMDLHWRWTPTAEERLLAQANDDPKLVVPPPALAEAPSETPPPTPEEKKPAVASVAPVEPAAEPAAPAPAPRKAEWPGFRGPERDSVIRGVRINTDWTASPPVETWRRPIGPGWSSFSVNGDLLYTQEQRGEEEIVACYRVSTGEPVWRHRDPARFWESNGGPGPRGTPTLHGDRVYAFGATGILNALDAATGQVAWSHNVATDTGRDIPFWGFASSPLVIDDLVVAAAAGTLAAYDLNTGKQRWTGPSHGGSYSSPHRMTIDGVVQIVLLGGPGVISVAPADGTVLWKHEWVPGPIVQPAMLPDGDIVINAIVATGGVGTRRLHVTQGSGGWKIEERWTSNGLKPYFNDFVVHKGHAFGFDGSILASINLEDGKRNWKGGRYGNGQLVLLADQDLLLVMSEDGELALVSATTHQYKEVARFPALNAKTWNHPVLIGDVLLVRNGEEMAAFRLSLDSAGRTTDSGR